MKNKNPELFRDSMRRLYYDTCVYNVEALDLLFKIVGPDRCLFGTELPGTGTEIDPVSGRVFDDIKPLIENEIPWLTAEDKSALLEGNARQLFKLEG